MMTHALSCTAIDDRLADYLEGDLGPAEQQAVEAHLASCVRCSALVRDLQQIRDEAAELGELAPSRDLWAGVAARIEAPIVPLAPRGAPNVATRGRGAERLRLAAVAAALVAVTASVTYTLTASGRNDVRNSTLAANTIPPRDNDSVAVVARGDTTSTTVSESRSAVSSDPAPVTPDRDDATTNGRPSTQAVGNSSATTAASASSREIDRLRTVFLRNRSQLDPRTAAIIEANLKVIDDAIAQSKAALAQDPASRFLNNQLNNALDKKLELLRTAAQLPSRT